MTLDVNKIWVLIFKIINKKINKFISIKKNQLPDIVLQVFI
jgi:hypothetical protein